MGRNRQRVRVVSTRCWVVGCRRRQHTDGWCRDHRPQERGR